MGLVVCDNGGLLLCPDYLIYLIYDVSERPGVGIRVTGTVCTVTGSPLRLLGN